MAQVLKKNQRVQSKYFDHLFGKMIELFNISQGVRNHLKNLCKKGEMNLARCKFA